MWRLIAQTSNGPTAPIHPLTRSLWRYLSSPIENLSVRIPSTTVHKCEPRATQSVAKPHALGTKLNWNFKPSQNFISRDSDISGLRLLGIWRRADIIILKKSDMTIANLNFHSKPAGDYFSLVDQKSFWFLDPRGYIEELVSNSQLCKLVTILPEVLGNVKLFPG
ncbi:hypothetical protein AVEN_173878-1 [Araneus ventricosus]|uniref:Uncharacterized protein n=1 Tax=Araneus ventricosus TaxID=182803 RepID=A0A4Y2JCZ3_ARAVE|nr:hypothetical protein AVEN_266170-1 [Araneus ventricosus]GBM87784.1 hypothetical protein AVEN_173878-1 [Araneus ventricosus]